MRSRESRRRVGRSGAELPERCAQRKSGKEGKECRRPGNIGEEGARSGGSQRSSRRIRRRPGTRREMRRRALQRSRFGNRRKRVAPCQGNREEGVGEERRTVTAGGFDVELRLWNAGGPPGAARNCEGRWSGVSLRRGREAARRRNSPEAVPQKMTGRKRSGVLPHSVRIGVKSQAPLATMEGKGEKSEMSSSCESRQGERGFDRERQTTGRRITTDYWRV